MTTIALVTLAAGTGPAGIAIAAAVGGILDNALVYPFLFPPPTQYGPRLDTLQLSVSSEGSDEYVCIGPKCRIPCAYIWLTDLVPVDNNIHSGGKAGSGGDYVETVYFVHAAAYVCTGRTEEIEEIWGDAKKIYDLSPDVALNSNEITGTVYTTIILSPGGSPTPYKHYMRLTSPSSSNVYLQEIRSGRQVTLSGFTGLRTSNNGDWEVSQSSIQETGEPFIEVERPPSGGSFVAFSAGADTVDFFQSASPFSKKTVSQVRIYNGDDSQSPDPLIQSFEGVDVTPAFKGKTYFVLQKLWVLDFGNREPSLTVIVRERTTATVGDAISLCLSKSKKLNPSQYDTSACTDELLGFWVRGVTPIGSALQPLLAAFDIIFTETTEGKLVFYPRSQAPIVDITPGVEFGEGEHWVKLTKLPLKIPSEIHLRFVDPDYRYEDGEVVGYNPLGDASEIKSIEFPITMTRESAQLVVNRLLYRSLVARKCEMSLPPSYADRIREGVRVRFTYEGVELLVTVTKLDRDVTDVLRIEGYTDETQLEDSGVGFGAISSPISSYTDPNLDTPQVNVVVMNTPALDDDHVGKVGLYFAVDVADQQYPFTQVGLFEARDEDPEEFTQVATIVKKSKIGRTVSVLPAGTTAFIDESSYVDVYMPNVVLTSTRTDKLLAGRNRFWIAGEIIGARTITEVDTDTYRLSGLLRGLRDTAHLVGAHADGDVVVYLNESRLYFHELNKAAINKTRYYKAVSVGGDPVDYGAITVSIQGETVRPFAPAGLRADVQADNSIVSTWTRRTRSIVDCLTGSTIPLLEGTESYDVKYIDESTSEIVRTRRVYSPTDTYSAAERTADGTSAHDVRVVVSQIGEFVRRGRTSEVVAS